MHNYEEIKIKERPFGQYRQFNKSHYRSIVSLAKKLKGRRIFHVNATEMGGGVAEILKSQVALERGLGIDSRWYVIRPSGTFFVITKKIHNLLQGKDGKLTKTEKEYYTKESCRIAKDLNELFTKEKPDLIVIHDPQPLTIVGCEIAIHAPKIIRLHIDLSTPNEEVMNFFEKYVEKYELAILSRKDYRPKWLPPKKTKYIMPAIDPLEAKNRALSLKEAKRIIGGFGIDISRPIIAQISRFDPWKDPAGVIRAYYKTKQIIPELQLMLVGFFQALDDPEGEEMFAKIEKHAGDDPDIYLFADTGHLTDVNNEMFVNATQVVSDIIIQNSYREGFGLTITEAMWKGKVVIGGKAESLKLQIKNGKSGYLAKNEREMSELIIKLLKNPKLINKVGKEAKKSAEKNFLLPRYLKENFEAYLDVMR